MLQVVEKQEYQAWCAKFGPSTSHIFVNRVATGGAPVMASSALLQAKLNAVHPTIFPMHQHDSAGTSAQATATSELAVSADLLDQGEMTHCPAEVYRHLPNNFHHK